MFRSPILSMGVLLSLHEKSQKKCFRVTSKPIGARDCILLILSAKGFGYFTNAKQLAESIRNGNSEIKRIATPVKIRTFSRHWQPSLCRPFATVFCSTG